MNVLQEIRKAGVRQQTEIDDKLSTVRGKPNKYFPSATVIPESNLYIQACVLSDGTLRNYFRWTPHSVRVNENFSFGHYVSHELLRRVAMKKRYGAPEFSYIQISYLSYLIVSIVKKGFEVSLAQYLKAHTFGDLKHTLEAFIKRNGLEIETASKEELSKAAEELKNPTLKLDAAKQEEATIAEATETEPAATPSEESSVVWVVGDEGDEEPNRRTPDIRACATAYKAGYDACNQIFELASERDKIMARYRKAREELNEREEKELQPVLDKMHKLSREIKLNLPASVKL
jgi:hypothetical protein